MSGVTIAATVGVAASVFGVAFALRRKPVDGAAAQGARADELEGAYQNVLTEIRALDADRQIHAPDEYERERSRLTREAARLLKLSEQARAAEKRSAGAAAKAAPKPAAKQPASSARDFWLGMACGAGTVVLATVLMFVLSSSQSPRADAPMAQRASSDELPPGHPGSGDPLAEALTFARSHPEDVDTSAQVARELLSRRRTDEAAELVDAALAVTPDHLASRINRALIEGNRGDPRTAIATLGKIAEEGPTAREALLFRGSLALRIEDKETALESFERYAREAPAEDHPGYLAHVLEILRARESLQ